jgi:hypothetical protein
MVNVTGGKQSGNVGFKIIRMAIKWPTFGHLALVQQVRARDEIARFIAGNTAAAAQEV